MNWDAVGAVAELLGAIAVIATLVYLSIQVRQNTQSANATSTDKLADDFNQFTLLVLQDKEINRFFREYIYKNVSLDDVPEEDRFNLRLTIQSAFTIIWRMYEGHRNGYIPDDGWNMVLNTCKRSYFRSKVVREIVPKLDIYPAEFLKFLDENWIDHDTEIGILKD